MSDNPNPTPVPPKFLIPRSKPLPPAQPPQPSQYPNIANSQVSLLPCNPQSNPHPPALSHHASSSKLSSPNTSISPPESTPPASKSSVTLPTSNAVAFNPSTNLAKASLIPPNPSTTSVPSTNWPNSNRTATKTIINLPSSKLTPPTPSASKPPKLNATATKPVMNPPTTNPNSPRPSTMPPKPILPLRDRSGTSSNPTPTRPHPSVNTYVSPTPPHQAPNPTDSNPPPHTPPSNSSKSNLPTPTASAVLSKSSPPSKPKSRPTFKPLLSAPLRAQQIPILVQTTLPNHAIPPSLPLPSRPQQTLASNPVTSTPQILVAQKDAAARQHPKLTNPTASANQTPPASKALQPQKLTNAQAASATSNAKSAAIQHATPQVAQLSTQPTKSAHRSIALDIAKLVTDFLGPGYPRRDSAGATLNGLRTRLETDTKNFDTNRDVLIWQVREAIRTEFFKIVYPAPPTQSLLNLVTRTEVLLTNYNMKTRPFFFPGARVAVPTEAGSRRAGTTLQLRYKTSADVTVTEALLHLDGPNGGGFQWVQTQALTNLIQYRIPQQRRPQKPPPAQRGRRAGVVKVQRGGRVKVRGVAKAKGSASEGKRKPASTPKNTPAPVVKTSSPTVSTPVTKPTPVARMPTPPKQVVDPVVTGPVALPPTFLPESMLETGPPPRRRLRDGFDRVVSFGAGSLRRGLNCVEGEGVDAAVERIRKVIGVQRLVARRKVEGVGVEYFVKWSGRGMKEGSWERREALLLDVPGLVLEFDTKHPDMPKNVCHSDRVKSNEEVLIENKEETEEIVEIANGEPSGELKKDGLDSQRIRNDDEMKVDTVHAIDVKRKEQGTKEKEKNIETPTSYTDDVTGIKIPPFVDTPILEISFSGMVLQIRRPDDYALHNDSTSASRDYKKRQSRFKQENVRLGEKLFPLSKTEAKAALDASLRSHKAHGRHPIPFPRGIGRVAPSDTGIPFSAEVVANAPPSWERYLMGLGLQVKHFERNLPPFFPSLDAKGSHKLALAARDAAHERAVEHRERARRVVRMSYRHSQVPNPPTSLFRDGKKRPRDCEECFPVDVPKAKTRSPRVPPQNEQLIKGRDSLLAEALADAKNQGNERWYDPYWSCWRSGAGPSAD